MLGAEGVSTAIIEKIRASAPAKITQLRARYQVDKATLPMPASLHSTEKTNIPIEEYPAIVCSTVDTTGRIGNRQLGSDGEWDVYQYKYRMRIFVFVTGTGTEDTDLLRKRFVLAVREILLTNIILTNAGGQYAELEPTTLKESYSEVAKNQDEQLFAAAFLEFEVVTRESLAAYPAPLADEAVILPELVVQPDPRAEFEGGIVVGP